MMTKISNSSKLGEFSPDFLDIRIMDPDDCQNNYTPWLSPSFDLMKENPNDELLLPSSQNWDQTSQENINANLKADIYSLYKYHKPSTLKCNNNSNWSSESCNKKILNELTQGTTTLLSQLFPIKSSRAWTLRVLQITTVILGITTLFCLLVNKSDRNESPTSSQKLNFQSWVKYPINLNRPESNSLLDLDNFNFILNNASKCSTDGEGEKIFFIILIHSAPRNFEERQAIRSTWGSVQTFRNSSIRLIFLLGKSDSDNDASIFKESDTFGDIVSGNFVDSYRNLTYKHLMGYKWVLRFCPKSTFILKTDDDAFIDIFQLINFIKRTFGTNISKSLICNVLPEGTHPMRSTDDTLNAQLSKWSVSRKEYPYNVFPKYCSGLAYLISQDLLSDLLTISSSVVKYLWIDDVFVTGILRDLAGVDPFYLNLRFSYEPQEYRKWITSKEPNDLITRTDSKQISSQLSNKQGKTMQKLPVMFLHLERGQSLVYEMTQLWHRVSRQ